MSNIANKNMNLTMNGNMNVTMNASSMKEDMKDLLPFIGKKNLIEDIDDNIEEADMVDYPILIQYGGGSEAQVYLHEIILK